MYDEGCLKKIGANIRFLRMMRRIRQQDLAESLGISQTHLSNMECGRVNCSLKQLLRLANIFDCQLEALLDAQKAAECWGLADAEQEEDKLYTKSDIEQLLKLVKKGI